MQKIYLLLRSNKQTGPYSLEELLQLNLKPFDLVWVEGRSAAWQYPSEIPSLKPHVPGTPQTGVAFQPIATSAMEEKPFQSADSGNRQHIPTPQKSSEPKRVFVSVPKSYSSNVQRTEYTEQSPYAPKPQTVQTQEEKRETTSVSYSQSMPFNSSNKLVEEDVRTNYSRSLNDAEEDYTTWVYNKKTKKKASVNTKEMALAALILVVIAGGYYIMSKPSITDSVLPSNDATVQSNHLPTETVAVDPFPEEGTASKKATPHLLPVNQVESKNIKKKNQVSASSTKTNSSVPAQSSMPVEKTTPNIHDESTEAVVVEPEVTGQQKENGSSPEKKKKFGEVLKGIFSKKEKKEESKNSETTAQDPKPANNRQATRRETENSSTGNNNAPSAEESTASLMEQVEVISNAPDNWMLGVKNLKLTLKNRSAVTIQAASVTVNYYDENNQLLEKKLVYFNNVAPKAKATVSAPDHKFADHVDLRLTSVSAKDDRYANTLP